MILYRVSYIEPRHPQHYTERWFVHRKKAERFHARFESDEVTLAKVFIRDGLATSRIAACRFLNRERYVARTFTLT